MEHLEALNIHTPVTAGVGEMSEDFGTQDKCPHCRLAFEIVCVKFELVGAKLLAVCPNCAQIQSVTATNDLAAAPVRAGGKSGRMSAPRLPHRWHMKRSSKSESLTLSGQLLTSVGVIFFRWLQR
jgi:hypothetical protein